MKISEDEKFKEIILKYWADRFKATPIITRHRDINSREEAFKCLSEIFLDLRKKGFNVYAISNLLVALIGDETGYREAKKNIEKYAKAVSLLGEAKECLFKLQIPYGVDESLSCLQRFKTIWEQHAARWKSAKTPSKKGTKFIRCHMVHLLVEGSKIIQKKQRTKLIYNKTESCNKIIELIEAVGLTKKDGGLSNETLQKDYTNWSKLKVPVTDCRPIKKNGAITFKEIRKMVTAPTISFDPLL